MDDATRKMIDEAVAAGKLHKVETGKCTTAKILEERRRKNKEYAEKMAAQRATNLINSGKFHGSEVIHRKPRLDELDDQID